MTEPMIERLTPERHHTWDAFVAASANGTLFQRLDFLEYHGNRFEAAAHHLLWMKGGAIFAVLPLGLFQEVGGLVARSPFGASFGGFVHLPKLQLKYALKMVDQLLDHLRVEEVRSCHLTLSPPCYHRSATEVMAFALGHRGFHLENRELTHVIPLDGVSDPFRPLASSTRTQVRKAQKAGVTIERNAALHVAYPLAVKTKAKLGSTSMTHTEAELHLLQVINPDFVKVDVAWLGGTPIAANIFLCSPTCITSFYPSHLKEYAQTSALTLLTFDAIQWCIETGRTYLDLGCSSYRTNVNLALSEFKESFGAIGLLRDSYGIQL